MPYPVVMAHKDAMHRIQSQQSAKAAAASFSRQEAWRCGDTAPGSGEQKRPQAPTSHAAEREVLGSKGGDARHLHLAANRLERELMGEEEQAGEAGGRDHAARALASSGEGNLEPSLGAVGRVFEFAKGTGRPVVEKSAFFEGFGWVLCLEDASMWAQLLDGSQVVVSRCEAVYVGAGGERRMLSVSNGLVQVPCIALTCMLPLKRARAHTHAHTSGQR